MSKALKALDKMKDLIDDEWGLVDSELHDELYSTVKDALAELEDAKHNYKALEEMHNNSVAYATKIQNELNSSKDTIKYLQGEMAKREHRIRELQYEVSKVRETTRPIDASTVLDINNHLKGQYICERCLAPIIDHSKRKPHNYCPGCGRKVDGQ